MSAALFSGLRWYVIRICVFKYNLSKLVLICFHVIICKTDIVSYNVCFRVCSRGFNEKYRDIFEFTIYDVWNLLIDKTNKVIQSEIFCNLPLLNYLVRILEKYPLVNSFS